MLLLVGDCVLYTERVVDSGSGLPSDLVWDCRLAGGGLLRWQGESGSWAFILEESRRVLIMR